MEVLIKQKRTDGTVMAVIDGVVDGSSVVEAKNDRDLELKLMRSDDWKTINGAHVLIGKTGRILGGAGGKFTGKVFGKPFNKTKRLAKLKGVGTVAGGDALRKRKFDIGDSVLSGMDSRLRVATTGQLLALEKKFKVAGKSVGVSGEGNFAVTHRKNNEMASCKQPLAQPLWHTIVLSDKKFRNHASVVAEQRKNRDTGRNMPCSDANLAKYAVTSAYGRGLQNVLIATEMAKQGWSETNTAALYNVKGFNHYANLGDKARANMALKKPYYDIRRRVADQCRNEIIDIAKKRNKDFNLNANLSSVARKGPEEFFGEVFANSQLGRPNELGRAMNTWLKEKGLVNG